MPTHTHTHAHAHTRTPELINTGNRLVVTRGKELGVGAEDSKMGEGRQHSQFKINGDVRYGMMTIVSNTVLHM